MTCEQAARHLDAYVDRELDDESAHGVSEHLASCPTCRREVAGRHSISRLVQAAPYYSAPDHLRARIVSQTARTTSMRRILTWAAAAALVLLAGGAASVMWTMAMRGGAVAGAPADVLAEAVVDNHVRSMMATHLFDVQSTDRHTVKPWLSSKLDFSPPVADLAASGFPLIGGRLDYLDGRPVAALVYRRQQHIINVFVLPVSGATTSRAPMQSIRGFHVYHWVGSGMSCWAVSDLNEAELMQFGLALEATQDAPG